MAVKQTSKRESSSCFVVLCLCLLDSLTRDKRVMQISLLMRERDVLSFWETAGRLSGESRTVMSVCDSIKAANDVSRSDDPSGSQ